MQRALSTPLKRCPGGRVEAGECLDIDDAGASPFWKGFNDPVGFSWAISEAKIHGGDEMRCSIILEAGLVNVGEHVGTAADFNTVG